MGFATNTSRRFALAVSAAATLVVLHPGAAHAQARLDAIEVRPVDVTTGLPAGDISKVKEIGYNGSLDIDGKTVKADDLYVAVRLTAPKELFNDKTKLELEVRDASTGRIVAGRSWAFLYVGPGGVAVKALLVPDATCKALVFRARYGGKAIDTRIDFKCGE